MKLQIGEKIKALRLASDLTQEELANRAKLTRGFISQLENDQTTINLESLADILEALGEPLADFFTKSEPSQTVFGPADRVAVTGQGVSNFEVLVPGSTNNLMNPILLRLEPGEKLERLEPMPGEQFGYVLKGAVTLVMNGGHHKVPKGNCFYFEANQANQLVNRGNKVTELLWVTSPPHM
ncbi:MAG: helix-turn-helix domain-containing protein [candidate division Zixibacteria bacterium]|nr:helix-turn-helix domain-containing protein [candidate division Zixibacteria bacterium]